jgi:hypothetical protein
MAAKAPFVHRITYGRVEKVWASPIECDVRAVLMCSAMWSNHLLAAGDDFVTLSVAFGQPVKIPVEQMEAASCSSSTTVANIWGGHAETP